MTETTIGTGGILDFGQISIVHRRDNGLVEAYVPISLIYREDVPVDPAHVRELADSINEQSMQGVRTGQLQPVLLAEERGFGLLKIMDGYHRVAAQDLNSDTEVFSTIKPNCSYAEILDIRILSAAIHKSVQFPRMIEWVEQSWQLTPWSGDYNLKTSQALYLKAVTGATGARFGLDLETADEIRQWVEEKCRQWHIKPVDLYQNLRAAEVADPTLIREVRPRGDQGGALTPHHFTAIANSLPGAFELQREVAQSVMDKLLSAAQARAMAAAVKSTGSVEEAKEIIGSGSWTAFEPVFAPQPQPPISQIRGFGANQLEIFAAEEIEAAGQLMEKAMLSGSYSSEKVVGRQVLPAGLVQTAKEENELSLERSPQIRLTIEQFEKLVRGVENIRARLANYLQQKFGLLEDDAEHVLLKGVALTLLDIKRSAEYRGEPQFVQKLLQVVENEFIESAPEDDKTEGGYHDFVVQGLPALDEELQSRVVTLREFYHLGSVDISQILSLDIEDVRSLMKRARRNMINSILGSTLTTEGAKALDGIDYIIPIRSVRQTDIEQLKSLGSDLGNERFKPPTPPILTEIQVLEHPRGEVIYQSREAARWVIILCEGQAIVYNYSMDGNKRLITELVEAPSVLGEELLSGLNDYGNFAEAFTDCKLQFLERDELEGVSKNHPELTHFFLEAEGVRLQNLNQQMAERASKPIRALTAGILLRLARGLRRIEGDISQEDLADLIGITKDSASRTINEFKREGLLFWGEGVVQLMQPERLRLIYDEKSEDL